MSSTKRILALLGLTFLSVSAHASVVGAEGIYNACTSKEQWTEIQISEPWKGHFRAYLKGTVAPQIAISHAKKMRRSATSSYDRLFSTYWLSNALFRSQMLPVASRGFQKVLQSLKADKRYASIAEASLGCLLEVKRAFPSSRIGKKLEKVILQLKASDLKDELLYTRALENNRFKGWEKQFQPESVYGYVYRSLNFWTAQEWKKGAAEINKVFGTKEGISRASVLPVSHQNKWLVLAGRLNFAIGDFKTAESYYAQVDKRSNELVPSLTELAWTQLKRKEHNAAIGTALSLQTGWLQNTYSPEGLMVMSMAFNETCHYPESMRSLSLLKEQYKPVADWLAANKNLSGQDLYNELKLSLKKESQAPFRLTSEWVRSRKFLSRQTELNEGHRQVSYYKEFEKQARLIQQKKIADLLANLRVINSEISRHQQDEAKKPLPETTQRRLLDLRNDLVAYDDFKSISKMWRSVKSQNSALVSKRRGVLLSEIYSHIKNVNSRVFAQIQDINENIQFIEIEIYQGATEDMIFSNANPDFKKQLEIMKEKNKPKAKEGQMHWGHISTGSLNKSEIWEDELGGFKADLPNKCNKAQLAQSGL